MKPEIEFLESVLADLRLEFGIGDAMDAITDRIAELEAAPKEWRVEVHHVNGNTSHYPFMGCDAEERARRQFDRLCGLEVKLSTRPESGWATVAVAGEARPYPAAESLKRPRGEHK